MFEIFFLWLLFYMLVYVLFYVKFVWLSFSKINVIYKCLKKMYYLDGGKKNIYKNFYIRNEKLGFIFNLII